MKFVIILSIIAGFALGTLFTINSVYAVDTNIDPLDSVIFGDHVVSITRSDTTGTTTGNFLNQRGFDGIVYRVGGSAVFGEGFEVMRIDVNGRVLFPSGKTLNWENNQVSVGRSDTTGTGPGAFLNQRGFDGIIYRVGGADVPGAGFEVMRIDVNGNVQLGIQKPLLFANHQVSISRTDTTGGTPSGNFMTMRGFDGFIFKVVGADVAGDGVEIARIDIGGNVGIGTSSPAEKLDVNGNIKLTGTGRSITSDGDICIGTCP